MTKEEKLFKEVQSIKKLLVLLLIKSGATSEETGYAVGTDSSVIRRAFPVKKIMKVGGE